MSISEDIIKAIATAPESQLDPSMKPRLLDLIGKPNKDVAEGLKKILDECAHAALASDFVMVALDGAWKECLKAAQEGE